MTKKCGKNVCKCKEERLSDSAKKFPSGDNFRIEISGIETAYIARIVIDEAQKLGIPIHRMIATVAGSRFYTDEQLKDLAKVAAENKVEVIICPGDLARGFFGNPNRNLNWQNNKEIIAYRNEIFRCVKLGFRGFLTWSYPMLMMLALLRKHGRLPSETIFKLSTFANSCNALDFLLAKYLGANTVNTANGLTLENLSDIRKGVPDMIMDVHVAFWQNYLAENKDGHWELKTDPHDRINDAPEIVRVASPVYLKHEYGTPGIGVYNITSFWTIEKLADHKRHDVHIAAKIVETIKKKYPQLKLSDWGPEDLRVPKV